MPLTRQHIAGERPMRQRRLNEGVVIHEEDIQSFLADYERMNRTKGTVQFYRRKMKRFYEDLPEDKTVRLDTLREWQTSLLQKGYHRVPLMRSSRQQILTWIISGIVSTSWLGT